MNADYRSDLLHCETDVEGALRRFAGNEELYESCLAAFLDDPTMNDLTHAIADQVWDDAFTAAHALKGLAGNMGFIPLFHAASELVVKIRAGRIAEVGLAEKELGCCYDGVTAVIRRHCGVPSQQRKGE